MMSPTGMLALNCLAEHRQGSQEWYRAGAGSYQVALYEVL